MKTVWQEGKGFDFNTLKKADCARYNTNYCLGCAMLGRNIYMCCKPQVVCTISWTREILFT